MLYLRLDGFLCEFDGCSTMLVEWKIESRLEIAPRYFEASLDEDCSLKK